MPSPSVEEIARKTVKNVIKTLNGRGGFDHWWGDIGEFHDEIIDEAATRLLERFEMKEK